MLSTENILQIQRYKQVGNCERYNTKTGTITNRSDYANIRSTLFKCNFCFPISLLCSFFSTKHHVTYFTFQLVAYYNLSQQNVSSLKIELWCLVLGFFFSLSFTHSWSIMNPASRTRSDTQWELNMYAQPGIEQ